MTQASILLVGNCVLDEVWQLEQYPGQDDEVRALGKSRVLGGNACNTAQILAQLGEDVELVSSLARDSAAEWVLKALSDRGISTRFCPQITGFSTPQSTIWLDSSNGSRTIVHYRNLPELSLSELHQIPIQQYNWIHFEGRNVATLFSYLSGLELSADVISLEIEKDRDGIELLLPLITTVIVSSAYLKSKKITAEQCLEQFRSYNPALNIVCTLGASGIVAQDSSGRILRIDAHKVEKVVDTVGAGDCFIAGLIHQLNQQEDFESAIRYANKLAARKIEYSGMRINDE